MLEPLGAWVVPRRYRSGHPPLGCLAGGVITRTDSGDHSPDVGDHDAPIRAVTIDRNTRTTIRGTRDLPTLGLPTE